MSKKSRRGVALMLVLLSLALLTILSVEIITASRVELKIGRNAKERTQAYYLAQSSARFNLLRLQMYKEVRNLILDPSLPISIPPEVVDGIWSFPLPDLPLSEMKEIIWPGKISGSIVAEGSKIPINLLDANPARGSDETTANAIRAQLKNLIEGLLAQEDFDALYRGLKPEDLIDPLQDWIDADSNSRSGGRDESSLYDREDPPYKPRNDRIPTLSELHMIENWNDDLVRRISPQLTVLNSRGKINPNYVTLERLRTFEPKLTNEELAVIQARRTESPFASLVQLAEFIRGEGKIPNGNNFKFPEGIASEDRESVFYVNGSGEVGDSRRTIRLGVRFNSQKPPTPPPTATPNPEAAAKTKFLEPEVIMAEEIL